MNIKRKITSRASLALLFGGVLLLLILFNVLSGLFFGYVVGDITADKRYNLSSESVRFLSANNMSVTIRLYVSRDLKQASPRYGDYAEYINRLLNQYVKYGHGLINLEIAEIIPYSSMEISAEKFGLFPLDIEDKTHNVYLGANIIRADGAAIAIPIFDIMRKSIVEDDISRAISVLLKEKKPVIGVLSPYFNVAALGKVVLLDDDWHFIRSLKAAGFIVKPLSSSSSFIPEDIDALLVFYPASLMPMNIYAIDQYLLRGGNVMAMLDSFSEARIKTDKKFNYYDSGMQEFLNNLGVIYYENIVAGDLDNNQKVNISGRSTAYPLYIKISREQMADHPIMANLRKLRFNYSSLFNFSLTTEKLQATVLYTTGINSVLLSSDWVYLQTYEELQHHMKSEEVKLPLALLLEGEFKAFYRKPLSDNPELMIKMPPFIDQAEKPGKLLLAADSDMMEFSLWKGGSPDGSASFYSSDNFMFIRNAMDYLTSSAYVNVGQKFISHNKRNLDDILRMWADKYYEKEFQQTSQHLYEVTTQINQFYHETKDKMLSLSAGRQKKIYDLQNKERFLEQNLKQIDYQIQSKYHDYKIWFAVIMMILPALISVLVLLLIYYGYQRLCFARRRKISHE